MNEIDKIVIEGPNNVGKSTLIRALEEKLGWEVEHVSNICPTTKDFYDRMLELKQPMIFDRLHPGERVYPYLYDRGTNFTCEDYAFLVNKHKNHTLYIFVDADIEFVIRGFMNKNEPINVETILDEKELFIDVMKETFMYTDKVRQFKNHLGVPCDKFVDAICREIGGEHNDYFCKDC